MQVFFLRRTRLLDASLAPTAAAVRILLADKQDLKLKRVVSESFSRAAQHERYQRIFCAFIILSVTAAICTTSAAYSLSHSFSALHASSGVSAPFS